MSVWWQELVDRIKRIRRDDRSPLTSADSGKAAQAFALKHLTSFGLQLIAENIADDRGELDLILLDPATGWVVAEVRSFNPRSGRRLEDVLPFSKQRQVTQSARRLLQKKLKWKPTDGLRFDAVIVELDEAGKPAKLEHHVNAWYGSDRGWKP